MVYCIKIEQNGENKAACSSECVLVVIVETQSRNKPLLQTGPQRRTPEEVSTQRKQVVRHIPQSSETLL